MNALVFQHNANFCPVFFSTISTYLSSSSHDICIGLHFPNEIIFWILNIGNIDEFKAIFGFSCSEVGHKSHQARQFWLQTFSWAKDLNNHIYQTLNYYNFAVSFTLITKRILFKYGRHQCIDVIALLEQSSITSY